MRNSKNVPVALSLTDEWRRVGYATYALNMNCCQIAGYVADEEALPYRTCTSSEFRCMLSGQCISYRSRCDSICHCSDCSDEFNCGESFMSVLSQFRLHQWVRSFHTTILTVCLSRSGLYWNTLFSVDDKVLIKSLYQFSCTSTSKHKHLYWHVVDWYKLLIKTLSLAVKTMFTQRCRNAITMTWKTRQFRHFTSEHYTVSKSKVFEKVITASDFLISPDDMPKIVKLVDIC